MKAVVLVGGFGTRIEEIAQGRPKTMLEIYDDKGNLKPIFYLLLDKINKANTYGEMVFDEILVVTNEKYNKQMNIAVNNYFKENPSTINIKLFNDKTTCNENRLGANGDLQWLKKKMDQQDIDYSDIMILAGDNYFDFDLIEVIDFYETKKFGSMKPTIFVAKEFEGEELETAKKGFAILKINESGKIVEMVEKPALKGIEIDSNIGAIALYVMGGKNFALVDNFLEENKEDPKAKDNLGNFGSYLTKHTPAYAWTWNGKFVDIGTVKAYTDLLAEQEKKFEDTKNL